MATHTSKRFALHRGLRIVLRDLLCVGLVLVTFALFHHALPRPASAISNIVSLDATATPTSGVQVVLSDPQAVIDASAAAGITSSADTISANGTDAPTSLQPTAEPAVGDFSASFPTEDTGVSALYSYQSDTLRIAIHMVQENEVTYYVADVYVKNSSVFRTAFAKNQYGTGIYQEPLKMAEANNAIFAVTGDYYGARSKGVVIRNGDLYRDSVNSDVCVLYADGVMETYREADFDVQSAIDRGAWQAWSFGPVLLDDNGQALSSFDSSIQGKNPRNTIGYYAPGHYCFVTVDGRQSGYSVGMTFTELSALFESLGCKAAFNLDGGRTAEMIFQGQLVNKPYKGGRQSGDIIYF